MVSEDLDDFLGSCIFFCFIQLVSVYHLSYLICFFLSFVFAGKMKDLQALVNEANKKVIAKKRRKIVQSIGHLIAGSGPSSTSDLVVVLEGEDRHEERV